MARSKKFSTYLTTWLYVVNCSCMYILGQRSIFSEHSKSKTLQTGDQLIPVGQYAGRRVSVGSLQSGHIDRPGTIVDRHIHRSGFHGANDKVHTSTLVQHGTIIHPTRNQHVLPSSNIPGGVVIDRHIDDVGVHGNHGPTARVHTRTLVQPGTVVHPTTGQHVLSSSNIPGGVVIDRHIDDIGVHGNHGPTARVHTRTLVQPGTVVHPTTGQHVLPSSNIPGGVVIDRHIDDVGVHGNHGPTARVHTRTLVQHGTVVHPTTGQHVLPSSNIPDGVVIDRHIDDVGVHGNHGPTARVHTRTLVQPGTVVHATRDSLISSGHLHPHGVGENVVHSARTRVIDQHVDPPFTDGNNSPVPAVHTTVVEKTHGTDPVHDHHHDIHPAIGRRGRRRFGRRGRGWRRGRGRGWRRGRRRNQIQVETGGLAGILGGLLNAAFGRITLG